MGGCELLILFRSGLKRVLDRGKPMNNSINRCSLFVTSEHVRTVGVHSVLSFRKSSDWTLIWTTTMIPLNSILTYLDSIHPDSLPSSPPSNSIQFRFFKNRDPTLYISVNRMVRRLRRCKDIYFGLYGRLKVKVYSLHTHVGHPFTSVSTAQYCGHNTWGQSKQSHLLHPRLFLFLWLKGQSGWGSQKIGSHGPAEKVFCVTLSCMSELVQKLTY